jgi:uncharacterized protein (DUF1499 family)
MSDRFGPCPDSPNCVSSLSTDQKHHIEPLSYTGGRSRAREKLLAALESFERVNLVTVEADYIRAEFRSRIFGFVDIAEFCLPTEDKVIHVKSASRVGYSDLGVNRKRVENIRALFNDQEL